MASKSDAEYYTKRAAEHRKLSQSTAPSRISEIHAEFAQRYAERALATDVNDLSETYLAALPKVRQASAR